jgi:hypothetical protein
MPQLSTYAKYNTLEDSRFMVELLEKNNIYYEVSHEINQLDNIYLGDSLDQLYLLKISNENFMTVNRLLAEQANIDFNTEFFTHYFDQFDEYEIVEVLNNPNDWNAYDNEIARLLLAKKYKSNHKETTALEYSITYKPEKLEVKWLIAGYFMSFSPIGIWIGSSIARSKKTLQNGSTVFLYDDSSRKHGGLMIILGSFWSLWFFTRLILH